MVVIEKKKKRWACGVWNKLDMQLLNLNCKAHRLEKTLEKSYRHKIP